MSYKKLDMFMTVVLLTATLFIGGCGKNYDDPKVFTEEKITDIALKSPNQWFPKDKKVRLKFKLTDISVENMMGEEHITFKGKIVLPENCYQLLNLTEEIGLDTKDFEVIQTYFELQKKSKTLIVEEFKAGVTVDVNGFYKRHKNPMSKKSEWEMEEYTRLLPEKNLTLEQKIKDDYKDQKILKKGTKEFEKYLEDLKSEYEKEKKRLADQKKHMEKLQKELSDCSAEMKNLQKQMDQMSREYNRNSVRQQTLEKTIANETRNLNHKRGAMAQRAKNRIDSANQEIKSLKEKNLSIKEKGIILKKEIAEKKTEIEKLQKELQLLMK